MFEKFFARLFCDNPGSIRVLSRDLLCKITGKNVYSDTLYFNGGFDEKFNLLTPPPRNSIQRYVFDRLKEGRAYKGRRLSYGYYVELEDFKGVVINSAYFVK